MIISIWFLNWKNWDLCTKERYTLEEQYFKLSLFHHDSVTKEYYHDQKFNHGPLKTTLTLDLKNCYVSCKFVLYSAFSLSWFKNWSLVEFKCLHCSGASHKDQETWSDLILLFINTWRKWVALLLSREFRDWHLQCGNGLKQVIRQWLVGSWWFFRHTPTPMKFQFW